VCGECLRTCSSAAVVARCVGGKTESVGGGDAVVDCLSVGVWLRNGERGGRADMPSVVENMHDTHDRQASREYKLHMQDFRVDG
jgi:hypothetical protein